MRVLLDTNVLMRLTNEDDPQRPTAKKAVEILESAGGELFIVPQNVYEYWTAATRVAGQNGFGMTPEEAIERIESFAEVFTLLDDDGLVRAFLRLMKRHDVRGPNSYDGRLVAAMELLSLSHLLTFNVGDFRRYSEIEVLDPNLVVAGGE